MTTISKELNLTVGGDRGQGAATRDTEREAEGDFSPVLCGEQDRGEGLQWRPGVKGDTCMRLAGHGGEDSDLRNHLCPGREPPHSGGQQSPV